MRQNVVTINGKWELETTCNVTSQASSGVRQMSKNSWRLRSSWNSVQRHSKMPLIMQQKILHAFETENSK